MNLIQVMIMWLVFPMGPLVALLVIGYAIVNAPLRRREQARGLLAVIDGSLKDGQPVESTIVSVSKTRDPGLGPKFHRLAKELGSGLKLSEALARVPRLLPRQIVAMLKAGEQVGDLRKVMPTCRHLLKDRLIQWRSSLNYTLVVAFVTTPIAIGMLTLLQVFVFPKLMAVSNVMEAGNPWGIQMLVSLRVPLLIFEFLLLFLVWVTAFVYIAGQNVLPWFDESLSFISHRLFYAMPWRRKRMQRDFSTILAILLDGGMPESHAVALAADCTGNEVFRRRAAQARAGLEQGLKLTEVIRRMDDTGEFHWRLTNALQANGTFGRALTGWTEALDARAFQQEQSTAQIVTTSLVLLNGLFVGVTVTSIFGMLISILNEGLLW